MPYYYEDRGRGSRQKKIKVTIGLMHGDADLYGRFGAFPNPAVTLCPPPKAGRRIETCIINNPGVGIYDFAICGHTDFHGVLMKIAATVSKR